MNEFPKMNLMLSVCALLVVYSRAMGKWGDKEFGKCPPENTRFQVFPKTSIKDCVKECAKRPVCKVIGYKRSYNMCQLHTAASPDTETINDKKCVQIKMDTVDISQIIGDCSCEDWQVCDVTTSTCPYKECDPHTSMLSLTDKSGVIYGNMNNIDSRKRLRCNPGIPIKMNEDTTVCGTTGEWNTNLECECILGNVAVGKPAVQSSNYFLDSSFATAAVDGNTDQLLIEGGSCFHTNQEANPWWRVDLEDLYYVTSFVLYNRMDCCSKRTHDIEVKFGQKLDTLALIDFIPGVLPDVYHKDLESRALTRYAQVSIKSTDEEVDNLHLCEVELVGCPA